MIPTENLYLTYLCSTSATALRDFLDALGRDEMTNIKCGDHIHHEPSDEDWVVAYADGDHLVCQGWPETRAKLSDCKLIYSCTDDEHVQSLLSCAYSSGSRAYHGKRGLIKLGLMSEETDAVVVNSSSRDRDRGGCDAPADLDADGRVK